MDPNTSCRLRNNFLVRAGAVKSKNDRKGQMKMATELPLKERMQRKIKLQGKSRETFKTYWDYCEKFLRFCRSHYGDWLAHCAPAERTAQRTAPNPAPYGSMGFESEKKTENPKKTRGF